MPPALEGGRPYSAAAVWVAELASTTLSGLLRAAMPKPIGDCYFVNDLSRPELDAALAEHKRLCADYPRAGAGIDAYVGHQNLVGSGV